MAFPPKTSFPGTIGIINRKEDIMNIEGTTIHNEGADIRLEHQLRIRQISLAIRALANAAEINLKILKCETTHYEVLLWGTVNHLPLGIYSRGSTLSHALDSAAKKVSSYCAKVRAMRTSRRSFPASTRLAMAS
jgi:hypothetical protein